jgi:DNA (cytosine-5)-methyltransferase 1
MAFRHVDLCSGIGGFALGFERAELSIPVLFCDIEPWSRKILAKHWPHVPISEDVKELANDPDGLVPDCDILTAGYPCQPFSLAGERRGTEDDRHIWPYILSIVKAKRPSWCVFENVYGHVSMGLDEVLSDLEREGYAARPFIVPACAADAPHRRDRVWIVARNVGNTNSQQRRATEEDRGLDMDRAVLDQRQGREEADAAERSGGNVADTSCIFSNGSKSNAKVSGKSRRIRKSGGGSSSDNVAYSNSAGLQGRQNARDTSQSRAQQDKQFARRSERPDGQNWLPEPAVGRVANGIPRRVDRLRGLGNAIVPQIAMQIGKTIKAVHDIPAQGYAHNNSNNQTT